MPIRWRVSIVEGSSMVQNQKFAGQDLGRQQSRGVVVPPVARAVHDVVQTVGQHGHPSDAALAHGDLDAGKRAGIPDHTHSAQADRDI